MWVLRIQKFGYLVHFCFPRLDFCEGLLMYVNTHYL